MYRKNTAGQYLYFAMINTDGTAGTGLTVSGYRSIDGGAQAAVTGTISEKGNGQYVLALSAADTNGNNISYVFTAAGAVPAEKTVVTTAADPTDSVRFGLTALPNAAPNANGGLPVLSSGATTLAYTISTLTTYTGNTPQTGDVFAKIGNPVSNTLAGDLAAIKADTASILTAVSSDPYALEEGTMQSATTGTVTLKSGSAFTLPANGKAWIVTSKGKRRIQSVATVGGSQVATLVRPYDATPSGQYSVYGGDDYVVTDTAGAVTASSVTDKTGYKLASDGFDTIVIETGVNMRQAMSPVLAAAAGVVSGVPESGVAGTVVVKNPAGTTARATASVDELGNRTAVTLNLPA